VSPTPRTQPLIKRLLDLGIAASLLGVPAPAAYAQLVTTAPAWTGAFAGIAPGAKLGNASWTASQANAGVTQIDASSPRNYGTSAFRLGGYAGYNWQSGNWLFGPEVDFAWASGQQTRSYFPGCSLGCGGFTPPPGPNDTTTIKMTWDAGIRGRVGYLVDANWLIYGTGGLALQQVEATGACVNPTLDSQYCFGPGVQAPISRNRIMPGYTLGAGVETMYGSWLLRAEYRFAHFPGMSDVMGFPPSSNGAPNTYGYKLDADTHILTLGIAYKF
jgi:outer membrane immunogenic protein